MEELGIDSDGTWLMDLFIVCVGCVVFEMGRWRGSDFSRRGSNRDLWGTACGIVALLREFVFSRGNITFFIPTNTDPLRSPAFVN